MTGVSDVRKTGEATLSGSNMTLTKLPRSEFIRDGADGNSPCAEEPDEGESLTSGSGSRLDNTLCTACPLTVQITHPAHPLRGRSLPVRRVFREGGESHYVVEWPDGNPQRIPLAWTDQAQVGSAMAGARFSPHQLLTLRQWLEGRCSRAAVDKDEEANRMAPEKAPDISGGHDHESASDLCPPTSGVAEPAPVVPATTAGLVGTVGASPLAEPTSRSARDRRLPGRLP